MLRQGDAVELLSSVPEGAVDLVCMDPPFCTGRVRRGRTDDDGFDDRWESRSAYFEFMRRLLAEAHRSLSPRGNLLLHCDWRTCHHLWIALEEIFGADRAVNHLIWSYGLGGSGPRAFARKHDDILFFSRSEFYWFDPPLVPSRSRRMAGAPKKATDVIEIPAINNMAAERTGWPSQKPLPLLELLVGACSPPAGVVLDPFCGSGTTLVAAVSLGRHAIGFDRSARAIEISRRRLSALLVAQERSEAPRSASASSEQRSRCASSALAPTAQR